MPLTLMDHNRTNSKHPSSSTPSWKTKKLMCAGIIGMTAAVASSALLLFSIIKKLSGTAPTEELFLLHASVGADDDKCVAATGPWPTGSKSYMQDDDDDASLQPHSGPYVSCFVSTTGGYCWFHSYYNSETWNACTHTVSMRICGLSTLPTKMIFGLMTTNLVTYQLKPVANHVQNFYKGCLL